MTGCTLRNGNRIDDGIRKHPMIIRKELAMMTLEMLESISTSVNEKLIKCRIKSKYDLNGQTDAIIVQKAWQYEANKMRGDKPVPRRYVNNSARERVL